MIRVLHPGEQAVLTSFKQDYWEATIEGTVISAYQPSERLPTWTITDRNSDFVAELPSNANTNLKTIQISTKLTTRAKSTWCAARRCQSSYGLHRFLRRAGHQFAR